MYEKYIKRLLDIIFSLILLPFLIVIVLVFGFLIKMEDHGPIFYCGKRLGKDKKIFKMYKLRSMKVNAPDIRNEDGTTHSDANDDRLTKVGKFIRKTSIDEFPQVLNVLKGDMSFIGPRPDLPDSIETLYTGNDIDKLRVLPGITGYSQAYYRNSISIKQRFVNDIYYAEHISLLLDIKIIFRTFYSVLMRKNLYRSE